jgi:hypothetical protein
MIGWLFSSGQYPGGRFEDFMREPVCAGAVLRKMVRVAMVNSSFHIVAYRVG